MLLSVSELLEHVETDLPEDALQRLLNDAEAEIMKRFGLHASQVDTLIGGDPYLFPSRPISAVTEIVETIADTDTTLAADDWKLLHNGRQIERLDDGTNGRTRWGDRIRITYTPQDDTDQRSRVQVDLVKLAMQFEGLDNSRVGPVTLVMGDYEQRRRDILSRLAPAFGI